MPPAHPPPTDPKIRALAESYVKTGANKRAVAAVKLMLEKGFVTTDDLNDLGYNHPPRAIGDVRDAGIPVITGAGTSERSGREWQCIDWAQRLTSSVDESAGAVRSRKHLRKH